MLRDPHATVFLLPEAARAHIEPIRRRWDPVMAGQIAAHVTVTYPSEISTLDDLLGRVQKATAATEPFRIGLGQVSLSDDGTGVLVEVIDREGGLRRLRAAILGIDEPLSVPHVTLVHPRTSDRATDAWEELGDRNIDIDVEVREAAVTAFDGERWATVERFPLRTHPASSR